MSTILAGARTVVLSLDTAGRCVWVSPSVGQVWGRDPAEVAGLTEVIHPADRDRVAAEGREALAAYASRFRVITGDGGVMWVEATFDPSRKAGMPPGWTVCLRDITPLVRAEERMEATLLSALEPHAYLRAVRDPGGHVTDFVFEQVNAAACRYLQRSPDELQGSVLSDLLVGQAGEALVALFAEAVDTGEPLVLDEQPFAAEAAVQRRFDIRAIKVGEGLSLDWRDVTERFSAAQELAASEEHFRQIAESLGDVVRSFDLKGIHQWVSPSVQRLLGYTPQELIGTPAVDLIHPDDLAVVISNGMDAVQSARAAAVPRRTRLRHRDGRWVWTETANSFRYGPDGSVVQVYAVSRDVEAQVRAENELKRLAQTDPLTGLLNRATCLERLAELLSTHGRSAAVMFCDIDDLKTINDSQGHAAGDAVIMAAARCCADEMAEDAIIGRFGGDELLVVLADVADLEEAVAIAERLRRANQANTGRRLRSSLSIGVTVVKDGETVDEVVARADAAMYAAKAAGRNRVLAL